jgi:hypothetical protein
MSTPDANGWIKGIESAPKDEQILVCIPTEEGVEICTALWDEDAEMWSYDSWEQATPTHWTHIVAPVEYETAEAAA